MQRGLTDVDVLLLSMPFGLPHMPSLGLSLLKAELAEVGVAAGIRYLGLDFANRTGYRFYQEVAQSGANYLGDLIFYESLWGTPDVKCRTGYSSAFDASKLAAFSSQPGLTGVEQTREATRFIEDCAASIDWRRYRIIGFTTMFQQNIASLALARRIKERSPESLIVFGGPNCEGEMGVGLMRCFPEIDYIFSGEADLTFPAFARAVMAGEVMPPEQSVRPVFDMDALPYPDFTDFFEQLPALDHPVRPHLNFECARGCWWGAKHHCKFCGLNGSTMSFRSKSPDRALAEIEHLQHTYVEPYNVVLLRAADQILDMRYLTKVLPRVQEVAPGTPLFFETKSNLRYDQVQAFASAGVSMIQPGIESLITSVLKLMDKGCTALQNLRLLKWCNELGITPIWNLLYGFPGENPLDYMMLAEIIPWLTHLQAPKNVSKIRLDRFSPYFNDPQAHGIENVRPPSLHRRLYPFDRAEQFRTCYHFDFDYVDKRSFNYAEPMKLAAKRWMAADRRDTLIGFLGEDDLLVWDERPVAKTRWTSLRGVYREALVLLDDIHGGVALLKLFSQWFDSTRAKAELLGFLKEMDDRRLVMRDNDQLLSLIVLNRDGERPWLPDSIVETVECGTRYLAGVPHAGVQGGLNDVDKL